MEKEEIFTYFKNHRSYFKGVSEEEIKELQNMQVDQLGFMNASNFQITPLLRQICHYALVPLTLLPEELEVISDSLYSNPLKKYLTEISQFTSYCSYYVDELSKNNCHHPSVSNAVNLLAHQYYYNEIQDLTCELCCCDDTMFRNDMINCMDHTDEKLLDMIDSLFEQLNITLKEQIIFSKEELLWLLTDYVENKLLLCGMFGIPNDQPKMENTIYYIEDHYIYFTKKRKMAPNFKETTFDYLNAFLTLIKKVENYQKYSVDQEIIDLIEQLKDSYFLYESYRYKYLKDSYREFKLLEKCKKM